MYVVITPEKDVLCGKTHDSRVDALTFAERHTELPWDELAEDGYRIKQIVTRVPIARRVVSLSIDIPEEQMQRLEFLSQRSGMPVRQTASVLLGQSLAQARVDPC